MPQHKPPTVTSPSEENLCTEEELLASRPTIPPEGCERPPSGATTGPENTTAFFALIGPSFLPGSNPEPISEEEPNRFMSRNRIKKEDRPKEELLERWCNGSWSQSEDRRKKETGGEKAGEGKDGEQDEVYGKGERKKESQKGAETEKADEMGVQN